MPVNSLHQEYELHQDWWRTLRDVMEGDRAVKRAGIRYIPRLEGMNDLEYRWYVERGFFYNATARTVLGYLGMIFRREPQLKLPEEGKGLGDALHGFANDADLLGKELAHYAREVATEVTVIGRCGTLVDWCDAPEYRAYFSFYCAENILNWREQRINGRMQLTLVVLREVTPQGDPGGGTHDDFMPRQAERLRVLRLVPGKNVTGLNGVEASAGWHYVVEVWGRTHGGHKDSRDAEAPVGSDLGGGISTGTPGQSNTVGMFPALSAVNNAGTDARAFTLLESQVPMRRGKPLPNIPFIFHGPSLSKATVERSPISDIVSANLDHYRMNTDYKHGMHFTALPTAWVSGFDKDVTLRIGSSTAWVTEVPHATAGFLEFKGDGLKTFERALDRAESLLAVLGARLLESQKRSSESAEAIQLRQTADSSVIAGIAVAVSKSLTQALRWVYWWHSTEEHPDEITRGDIQIALNRDFDLVRLNGREIQALVVAWLSSAISQETVLHQMERGGVLPPGRSAEEEMALIKANPPPPPPAKGLSMGGGGGGGR